MFTSMKRIARVHPFAKGMGIAAPHTGIGRAAALAQPADSAAAPIVLLSPRIAARSEQTDEQ
ncbi:hypothetical protein [Streptomyces triculaminicus]|uniref:hypothetical protein n=1 Tax=Streptomyces triculaminicus TaxID=2816232 RepID=UPI001F5EE00E|nr:hypothetical protein [Streptomyces triculaminicus]